MEENLKRDSMKNEVLVEFDSKDSLEDCPLNRLDNTFQEE